MATETSLLRATMPFRISSNPSIHLRRITTVPFVYQSPKAPIASRIKCSHVAPDPKLDLTAEPVEPKIQDPRADSDTLKPYGSAKIHDFCFGIPYGSIVLGGGILGFIFTRNFSSLTSGLIFGGALMALSMMSLKTWKKGISSLPYVLGQGVLSGILFWKSIQTFCLSKKMIPSGFYVFGSAAMLCFYIYVTMSGGNPPPKKLRQAV